MQADLQSAVTGMRRGLTADVAHMANEALDGMEDIAADRLPDPDQHISLPPSIVALAAGVDVQELAASRAPRAAIPAASPALAPSPAPNGSALATEHERFMAELRGLSADYQQGTEQIIRERRKKLGLTE